MAPTRPLLRGDESSASRTVRLDHEYARRIDQRSGRIQKPLCRPISPRILDIQRDKGFHPSVYKLSIEKAACNSRNIIHSSSVHATFLPFGTQHVLLGTMQTLLEEACFYWNKKWLPIVLQCKGWDTPEAGELNQWWSAMRNYRIPTGSTNVPFGYSLNTLFVRIHQIRHAAVHRLRYSYDSLKRMVSDALLFTDALKDDTRAKKIRAIQNALHEREDVVAIERVVRTPLEAFRSTAGALQDTTNRGRTKECTKVSNKAEHPKWAAQVGNESSVVVSAHTRVKHTRGVVATENQRSSSNFHPRVEQLKSASGVENKRPSTVVPKCLDKSPPKRSKWIPPPVVIDLTREPKGIIPPPPSFPPSPIPLPPRGPPPGPPKSTSPIVDLTGESDDARFKSQSQS